MERDYEEVVGGLEVELGQLRLQLDSQMVSAIRLRVRAHMFSKNSNALEWDFSCSITLECSRNELSLRCRYFGCISALNRVRKYTFLTVRQHPVTTRPRSRPERISFLTVSVHGKTRRDPSASRDAQFGH